MNVRHGIEETAADLHARTGFPSHPDTVGSALPPDLRNGWPAKGLARAYEEERHRQRKQEKLQRELRAAEGCQALGRWGSFAIGVVWAAAILCAFVQWLTVESTDGASPVFIGALAVLPVSVLVYLVGSLRRRWVLHRARRQGFELTERRPILRRWIVIAGSAAAQPTPLSSSPAPAVDTSAAGAQLENALARDRQQRQQRQRLMQRRLDAAWRFEQWGYRDCLWSAFASVFFWGSLISSGDSQPQGLGLLVMFVSGLATVAGLPLGTLAVFGAKLRQRWLRRQARMLALEIADTKNTGPGRPN